METENKLKSKNLGRERTLFYNSKQDNYFFFAFLDSFLVDLSPVSHKFDKTSKIIRIPLSQYTNWNFKSHYKKGIFNGQKIKSKGM